MKRVAWVAVPLLILAGCTPEKPPMPTSSPMVSTILETGTSAHDLDIGDVETCLILEARLAAKSRAANVSADEMLNLKQELNMVTVTARSPFPESLWVQLKLSSAPALGDRVVAVRGVFLRDKEAVGSFDAVVKRKGHGMPRLGPTAFPDQAFNMDALEGLDSPPETMLLHVEIEALLMPKDVKANAVDPKTATAPPEYTTTMLSNPVRINFLSEGSAS